MRDALAVIGAYALAVYALMGLRLRLTRPRPLEPADPWQRYLDRRRPRSLITEWN